MPDTLPKGALDLRESIASIQVTKSLEEVLASAPADVQERVGKLLQEAATNGTDTGLVPMYVIRPGIGRGKGSHLYEADMLSKNAEVFKGWKMYVDHLSEAARKALGGLPRSIRDLGGRVTESWWDPSVPADEARGHGQGAVVGLSKPVPYVKELIDTDPELVESSISARATNVRPKNVGGQRVWVVEGIEPRGSVDWVTEAGAGGRVVSLIESYYEETEDMALLESLSDDDLLEHIQQERPELAAQLAEAVDPDGDGDDDTGEIAARVKQLMKKGLNRQMAEKAARREIASGSKEAQEGDHNDDEEGDDVPVDVAALREAFASDEGKVLVDELLEGRVEELFEERLPAIIEEKLGEERELIMVEARADADRKIQLRDMRDEAHRMISEAKIPDEFAKVAKAKFDLTEAGPTQALDVLDDLDAEGAIVKTAEEILAEAVSEEIEHQQRLLAAANPTRVRQPVAKATKKDDDGNEIEEAAVESTGSPKTDALLLAAGHDAKSLNKVFG